MQVELRAFCLKHSEASKECAQQVESVSVGVKGSEPFEDELLDTRSNLKSQAECIEGVEVKGSTILEDVKLSDSSNFTLYLKKVQ